MPAASALSGHGQNRRNKTQSEPEEAGLDQTVTARQTHRIGRNKAQKRGQTRHMSRDQRLEQSRPQPNSVLP